MNLNDIVNNIKPVDEVIRKQAEEKTAGLLMPTRAMGRLHDISEQICMIQRCTEPSVNRKDIIVMAGDHGVCEEGVSAYPSEITGMMMQAFVSGGATIAVLARQLGASITAVDMGIKGELSPEVTGSGSFISKRIADGTGCFTKGPAMTREQAELAVLSGFEVASSKIENGAELLGTGDMGIGNTTPSTAIGAVITGRSVEDMTGRGTGIDDEGLERKQRVIRKGIELNSPDPEDALDILGKVGGFEIGGIAGICLAAAYHRTPVVVDGLISTAGAMIAHGLAPESVDYMLSGHCSHEQGHRHMLNHLGLTPILDLDMRLGEGTGAALAMHIIQAAVNIFNDVLTFKDVGLG